MIDSQLMDAVKADDTSRVKELIDAGADLNQQDEYGWTLLSLAAGKGNLELVQMLVANGVDVLKVGRDLRTPYEIALAAGHLEVARFLRQAEEQVKGERLVPPKREYCEAYPLEELSRFPGWTASANRKDENGEQSSASASSEEAFSEDSIAFLHQDYTVTQSMYHGENVLFNQVTPEWKEFCQTKLNFHVPDDLELVALAKNADEGQAA
jgi:ankyrin repeat protein